MAQAQGVVGKINSREFNGKPSYSFVLKNQSQWYSAGWNAPTFKEGDSIQFDVAQRGNYFDAKNISPWSPNPSEQAPAVASFAGSKPAWSGAKRTFPQKDLSKDKYWDDKAKTDVVTQKRIEIQAARNASIEVVKLMLEFGLIAVPEKVKKTEGKQYLEALINELTDGFISNTSDRLAVDSGAGSNNICKSGADDLTQTADGEWE